MKNYQHTFKEIRNYLAGRLLGVTRDEQLLEEVVKILYCKFYIESEGIKLPKDDVELAKEYRNIFHILKDKLPNILGKYDEILLDPASLAFTHDQLSKLPESVLLQDPFGDAYEVFIGDSIRGQEGQFFTPQNVVNLLVSMVDPKPGELVIDPACGSGSFLNAAATHLKENGASPGDIATSVHGIDKDKYLSELASSRLSLITLMTPKIYCADSLAWKPESKNGFRQIEDKVGKFDVVLTNPPFGSKINAASKEVQRSFDLGYKWKKEKDAEKYTKTNKLPSSIPPQVLFLEQSLNLLKPGGRLGIVVPESLISSKNYRHVMQLMLENADLNAVIGMPEELFKTSGKGGTHTKTALIVLRKKNGTTKRRKFFMAEVKWCGKNSRGQYIDKDELPEVQQRYESFLQGSLNTYKNTGYVVSSLDLDDNILAPRYYDPSVDIKLEKLETTHELVKIQDLIDQGIVEISRGHEVGRLAYGTGEIPFVRTSDISNWEIKLDPKHGVSEDIYQEYAAKQDVRADDILMVKDGTYLIGTCAMVTKYDEKIVYQSHLYKIRVLDDGEISPYLLLAALSSDTVQDQIKSKRFTQDIIDSLGSRIYDLVIPIPRNTNRRNEISEKVKKAVLDRVEARELAREATTEIDTFAQTI